MAEIVIKATATGTIVIGFRDSNGDVDYTSYIPADGEVIDNECSDLGEVLADENDFTESEEFVLTRSTDCG